MTQQRHHLTLVSSSDAPLSVLTEDALAAYQVELLGAWEAQQAILNYSPRTIALNIQTVNDFLATAGKFIWEVTREDLDQFYLGLIGRGLTYSTRRRYSAALGSFLDYLRARRGEEIWQRLRVAVPDIIDRYNRHGHRADDRDQQVPPPAQETVGYFFAWLRQDLQACRKWATAARDYTAFQVLYGAGLRVTEAVMLDVHDLHFGLGPMGKLHVRHGKATRGSGPRSRWVPMLNRLDVTLRWYLEEVRASSTLGSTALFLAESGHRMSARSVRASLQRKLEAAGIGEARRFSPHGLRRACATHNCEAGLELLAMQQLLGHEHVGTTMAYVQPSDRYIERCYEQALQQRLSQLGLGRQEAE